MQFAQKILENKRVAQNVPDSQIEFEALGILEADVDLGGMYDDHEKYSQTKAALNSVVAYVALLKEREKLEVEAMLKMLDATLSGGHKISADKWPSPRGFSFGHLAEMKETMKHTHMDVGKLGRWLGWYQAAACVMTGHSLTLDRCIEINRAVYIEQSRRFEKEDLKAGAVFKYAGERHTLVKNSNKGFSLINKNFEEVNHAVTISWMNEYCKRVVEK